MQTDILDGGPDNRQAAVLGGEDVDAQDLALAIGVDADSDRRHVAQPATLSAALAERVYPDVGIRGRRRIRLTIGPISDSVPLCR